MFGVRIMDGRQIIDLKIFRSLNDARKWQRDWDHGDYDTASIFEVPDAKDVRDADSAIRKRYAARIKHVDTKESEALINSRSAKAEQKALKARIAVQKLHKALQADLLKQAEAAREASLSEARR